MPKKKQKKSAPDTSWRKIKQSSAARAVTTFAKKRRMSINLRYVGYSLALVATLAMIAGGVWWWQNRAFGTLSVSQTALSNIYFESDGVLDENWLDSEIEIPAGIALMEVDIHDLRQQLLEHGQTQSAEVERIFPDALKVTVTEHRPILRIVTMDAKGDRYMYLISETGQVYTGSHYSPATLKALPYLDGVALKRVGTGFEPITQAPVIAELLRLARTGWPELYSEWKIVSCRGFNGDTLTPGAYITVKSDSKGDIIFKTNDFAEQLQRLESIHAYAHQKRLPRMESVDLTLSEPAVRLSALKRRAGPHASR